MANRSILAKSTLNQVREFIAAQPVAPQHFDSVEALARRIGILDRLGLDDRLGRLHRLLLLETAGGGMLRRIAVDDVSTFEMRWQLPRVFADSRQPDLAATLYRAYHDSIPRLTRNHTAFIEDYTRFLIDRAEWLPAENLLRRLFNKALGGNPQLLVDLAVARNGVGSVDAFVQKFFLTTGLRLEVAQLAARRAAATNDDAPARSGEKAH